MRQQVLEFVMPGDEHRHVRTRRNHDRTTPPGFIETRTNQLLGNPAPAQFRWDERVGENHPVAVHGVVANREVPIDGRFETMRTQVMNDVDGFRHTPTETENTRMAIHRRDGA